MTITLDHSTATLDQNHVTLNPNSAALGHKTAILDHEPTIFYPSNYKFWPLKSPLNNLINDIFLMTQFLRQKISNEKKQIIVWSLMKWIQRLLLLIEWLSFWIIRFKNNHFLAQFMILSSWLNFKPKWSFNEKKLRLMHDNMSLMSCHF